MPLKIRVRRFFAPIVKLLARLFIKMHITPNLATWLMLFASIIATAGLVFWYNFYWFAIWVFITGILDGIDGAIARLTKKKSSFGGFFDSSLDRLSEGFIFLGLVLVVPEISLCYSLLWRILIGTTMLFSFMISYARARSKNK